METIGDDERGLARSGSSRARAPDRGQLVRDLQRVLAADPLFYPLAELVLVPEKLLGEGGMGVVHKVLDPRLGRRAALKLVKGVASDTRAKRFPREAVITARLDHPGIPPVYEAGKTASGQLFLLMRFVDGESLSSLLDPAREKPRPEQRELLGILVRVGEAISYAHSKKIVHRDLKPENIMVGSFGEVFVMDWGLARNLAEGSRDDAEVREIAASDPDSSDAQPAHLTRAGAVLGTLGYMPPEQAQSAEVDERADIFALGAVLTEVLSGKPPITGSSFMAVLTATIEAQIVLPRARRPEVAPELDAIAARALAPKADDRYPSAKAFTDDLRAYLEGRNVSVYGYGKTEQALRLVRRHATIFATGLVTVLASIVASIFLYSKNVEISQKSAEIAGKNDELERTVLALEKEKKDRALADRRRIEAEKAREGAERSLRLLEEARSDFGRASFAEIRKRALDAVAASHAEGVLFAAGRLLCDCNDKEAGRELLRTCADEWKPGYRALYALHETEEGGELGFKITKPLEEIVQRARDRGDENEFTLLILSLDALRRNDPDAALEAAMRSASKAPRFAPAYAFAGEARLKKKDDQGALQEFGRALEMDPRYSAVLAERGLIKKRLGDTNGALADLNMAVSISPNFSHFWISRGSVKVAQHDLKGALADFEQATKLSPPEADSWYNKGLCEKEQGDLRAAVADYRKALEIDPRHVKSHINLGICLVQQGDLDGAIASYGRALAVEPDHANALFDRGSAFISKGDIEAAIKDLSRAVQIDPTDVEVRGLLADARMSKGDVEGALAETQKGIEIDRRSARARISHGTVLLRAGRTDAAIESFDAAIALDARSALALTKRALARVTKGDVDGAIADCDRALELDASLAEALGYRVLAREKKGDLPGALGDCDRWVTLQPRDAYPLIYRSGLRVDKGDFAGALRDADRCVELVPGAAASWCSRAYVRLRKGDLDGATLDATKAIELDGKLSPSWNNRGEARVRKGELAGAATDIERALALDPTNAHAWKNRALLRVARGEVDLALADAKKALELEPRLALAMLARADALAAKGDARAAAEELARALPLIFDPAEAVKVRSRIDDLKRGG